MTAVVRDAIKDIDILLSFSIIVYRMWKMHLYRCDYRSILYITQNNMKIMYSFYASRLIK